MTFGVEGSPAPLEPFLSADRALEDKRVLIVGTGGLGTPSAYILSAAGVGALGLVDDDTVELSNLNRQILHTTSRIGTSKVSSAAQTLEAFFPHAHVHKHKTRFNGKNGPDLLEGYNLVVDGLDNVMTRYTVNDATQEKGVPFVHAGVLSFYGQASTFLTGGGPCYRCLFPEQKNTSAIPNCAESGVLGPVPGLMAAIQSAETIKLLLSKEPGLKGRLLMVDLLEGDFQSFVTSQETRCKCTTGSLI